MKMKNKLGTRQLPTAELLLDGVSARLVGEAGRGVAAISTMLSITRLHNTASAVGFSRKMLSLARDYATRRAAFGTSISRHPLHLQTLARMEVEVRGCCALFLDLAHKLGCEELGNISDEDLLLLRLLGPVAKMYTAKSAVAVTSEGLECFGGQGYIEDTGLPSLLRDAQVLPIWEGTSSINSLDTVRAIHKTGGAALAAMLARVERAAAGAATGPLADTGAEVARAGRQLVAAVRTHQDQLQHVARDLTTSLAHVYIAALLLEHAVATRDPSDVLTCARWVSSRQLLTLAPGEQYSRAAQAQEEDLVYQNYSQENTWKSTFVR